jgi:hypothetical protein
VLFIDNGKITTKPTPKESNMNSPGIHPGVKGSNEIKPLPSIMLLRADQFHREGLGRENEFGDYRF